MTEKWRGLSVTLNIVLFVILAGVVLYHHAPPLLTFEWQTREINRVTSPDGDIDAVFGTADAGAMTSTRTFVALLPAGVPMGSSAPSPQNVVFTACGVREPKLVWKSARLLEIHYLRAEILQFRNGWASSAGKVEIDLAPNVHGNSFPWVNGY